MPLLDFQQFLIPFEDFVKLLHFLFGHNAVIFTADEQNRHCFWYFSEVLHVILAEERQGESFLDLSFEEVKNKSDEWLRKTGLLGNYSPYYFF